MANFLKRLINKYTSDFKPLMSLGRPFLFTDAYNYSPNYTEIEEKINAVEVWERNPILFAVTDIISRTFSNGRLVLVDIKNNNEEIPYSTNKIIPKKLYKLLNNPNPFQNSQEFLKQAKLYEKITGDSFISAYMPAGYYEATGLNIENIEALYNIPSQYTAMFIKGADKGALFDIDLFKAVKRSDIISKYVFSYNKVVREFEPELILHNNDTNISLTWNPLGGFSRVKVLKKPLENIDVVFESLNVFAKKRGALGIFTSTAKNDGDVLPLIEKDQKRVQKALDEYGLNEGQKQYKMLPYPMTFQRVAMSPVELGLFEQIATETLIVANTYGVPEILVKTYIQGATYENQDASMKKLYQDTIIPEADSFTQGFNRWLNLEEKYGIKLVMKFDHIGVLQEDEKERSDTKKQDTESMSKQFRDGAIKYSEYLQGIGITEGHPFEDKYIFDLTDRELQILNININAGNDTNTIETDTVTE